MKKFLGFLRFLFFILILGIVTISIYKIKGVYYKDIIKHFTTKEETKKDPVIDKNKKYEYLISRLYPSCTNITINNYLDSTKLTDDVKVLVAIEYSKARSINVEETDDIIGLNGRTIEDLFSDETMDNLVGVSYADVVTNFKKIFGEEAKVNFAKIPEPYYYDKTIKAYFKTTVGCAMDTKLEVIDSVEEKDNILTINTFIGSRNFAFDSVKSDAICYDYVEDGSNCIYTNKVDKEYFTKNKTTGIKQFDYDKYMLDNLQKFASYKYTFIKEGNNYVFNKLERNR